MPNKRNKKTSQKEKEDKQNFLNLEGSIVQWSENKIPKSIIFIEHLYAKTNYPMKNDLSQAKRLIAECLKTWCFTYISAKFH